MGKYLAYFGIIGGILLLGCGILGQINDHKVRLHNPVPQIHNPVTVQEKKTVPTIKTHRHKSRHLLIFKTNGKNHKYGMTLRFPCHIKYTHVTKIVLVKGSSSSAMTHGYVVRYSKLSHKYRKVDINTHITNKEIFKVHTLKQFKVLLSLHKWDCK